MQNSVRLSERSQTSREFSSFAVPVPDSEWVLLDPLPSLPPPSLPPSPQVGSVWVYDPVLSEDELVVVESFGCLRIPVNEACCRAVTHPTLFFMLHCGMAMYTNLLGANWGREGLRQVAILGNPLSSYHLR